MKGCFWLKLIKKIPNEENEGRPGGLWRMENVKQMQKVIIYQGREIIDELTL